MATWERLAHVALSGSGDTVDSGTFTAYKNLKFEFSGIASGDVMGCIRFNSDNGSNYSHRRGRNGTTDGTGTSTNLTYTTVGGTGTNDVVYAVGSIVNNSDKEKLVITEAVDSNTAGAGNAPQRREAIHKWANTSDYITSIQMVNVNSGSWDSGSYITVWGATVAPATADVITVDCGTTATADTTSSGGTLSPTSGSSVVLATTSLGFTASNTWVLRFSTIFSSYGDNTYWFAYVANSDAGDQTNQNGIGSNWKKSSGVNTFGVHSSQNAQPYLSNPVDSQTISPDSSSKYYWEIIRLGDTSAKVNYYGTDSTYGTISSTSANTSISNATGLDRIKFFSGSSTNGSRTIAIADVEFYNGITAVTSGKKHLMVQVKGIGTGGTINCNLTFNSDTGSNYAVRESVNGGADSTNVSQANTDNLTGTVTGDVFATINIINEVSKEKLFISNGLESASGASNSPERKEMVGKWANTSAQITTIKANNGGTGSFAEGSEVTVYGTD